MDPAMAGHAINSISNPAERRVARLLRDVGLEFVAANSMFYDAGHVPTAEVDLVFASGGTTWIVEVSENRQLQGRRKKRKRLREWATKEGAARIAAKHELPKRNDVRLVYFDMSARPEGAGARDPKERDGVVILYREHVLGLERAVRRARAAMMDEFGGLVGTHRSDGAAAGA